MRWSTAVGTIPRGVYRVMSWVSQAAGPGGSAAAEAVRHDGIVIVEVAESQWDSVSDPGPARTRAGGGHRIILRPEQILFELDADPTWSEYDQANRELADREEHLRAIDATSGADHGDAVRVLRQRLEVQQATELAEYGARLADAVRGAALECGIGVDVVVELDTDLDTWGPVVIPLAGLGADVGALAVGVATAITATVTPRDLPGSPLDRLAAQQP